MTRNITFARSSSTVDELRRIMVEGNVGRVPVVTDEGYDIALLERTARVEDVVGIATRTDVLAAYQGRWEQEEAQAAEAHVYTMQALAEHPFFGPLFRACSALSEDYAGVYLVGGFVRDLLLEQPNVDVDIAVEGDGIPVRHSSGGSAGRQGADPPEVQDGGRSAAAGGPGRSPRPGFARRGSPSTSTSPPPGPSSTTTRRRYHGWSTLPSARTSSGATSTINAMAVSLRGGDFGAVIDFFGGYRDLKEGGHPCGSTTWIHRGPHRIFRAVRYENTLWLPHGRAEQGVRQELCGDAPGGDLSSVRLREELIPC